MKPFQLQQALNDWRKKLNKYPGFEPGTAEELLSHVQDAIDELVASGYSEEEAFHQVTEEKVGDLEKLSQEYYKAKSMKSAPAPRFSRSLTTNFLKVALRNMVKSKPHSYINLVGLAVGLASVILISIYVFSELSFDKMHKEGSRVYRVINKVNRSGTVLNYPQGPPALAPALTANFPELEHATRLRPARRPLIKYEDALFYEDNVFYADSSFFRIFDFPLVSGNPHLALNGPNQVVISEKLAAKYFGETDPLNNILLLEGNIPLRVAGVAQNVPHHSHLHFDMLISFQTYVVPEGYLANLDSWTWLGFITYTKTHEHVDVSALEQKIAEQFKQGDERWTTMDLTINLQPLSEIYLGSTEMNNPDNVFKVNSYNTLLSLMAVGLLIILIASFNYINLSMAMAMARFKEIAMRKVLGSTQQKLIFQFVLESVVYTVLALVMAVVIAYVTVRMLPDSISSLIVLDSKSLSLYGICLLAFTILIGIISGIAPALRLSSVGSLDLLKGSYQLKAGKLRSVLIGFQFALSASLITISLIIGKQIDFFTTKSLGFLKEGVVSINLSSDQLNDKTHLIKTAFRQMAGVDDATLCSHVPGDGSSGSPLYLPGQDPEQAIQMAYFQTDYDFARVMNIELVAGRYFSEDFPRDSAESIILNETAVKTLGLKDPIGEKVIFSRQEPREIIGVVKDYHYSSLHETIGSMAIIMPFTYNQNLMVKLEGDQPFKTIRNMEAQWNEMFPDVPFEFQFLEDFQQSLYNKEQTFSSIIRFFSILATGIACLGLYSLAAISLTEKLKQISIRRVLGAPVRDIIVLNARGFVSLVVLACILSWPLVFYTMKEWLSNFAYHIDLEYTYFGITFLMIILITLFTLSYHLYKAININPAEILRDN